MRILEIFLCLEQPSVDAEYAGGIILIKIMNYFSTVMVSTPAPCAWKV